MNKDIIKKYNYLITNSCAYDAPFVILTLNNFLDNLKKISFEYSFVLIEKKDTNDFLLKKLLKSRRIIIILYNNIDILKKDIYYLTNLLYPEKIIFAYIDIICDYDKLHEYIVSRLDKN